MSKLSDDWLVKSVMFCCNSLLPDYLILGT